MIVLKYTEEPPKDKLWNQIVAQWDYAWTHLPAALPKVSSQKNKYVRSSIILCKLTYSFGKNKSMCDLIVYFISKTLNGKQYREFTIAVFL